MDGARRPTLSYRLQTPEPAAVTVTVVNAGTRATVETLDQGTVAPGDGPGRRRGRARPQGRYAFVVSAVGADGATATTAQAPEPDTFVLLGHQFPIRGKHAYGEARRFGAGRAATEGVDIFAKCGTPLVAARGGIVKITKFQARAGNYLVIDDAGDGVDSMYAHLRDPALVEKGDARPHGRADRLRRRHRRRLGLPPALRGVERARAGTRAAPPSTRSPT